MMYATAWLVLPRLLESATPLCSLSHTWCRTPQAGSFCHKSETPQAESLIDLSHAKFHCSFIRNAFRWISFGRNNVCERIFVIFLHNYVTRICRNCCEICYDFKHSFAKKKVLVPKNSNTFDSERREIGLLCCTFGKQLDWEPNFYGVLFLQQARLSRITGLSVTR